MRNSGSFYFLVLALAFSSFASAQDSLSRARAYLLIKDPQSALLELSPLLSRGDKGVLEVWMEALAEAGDERGLLNAWDLYAKAFPEERESRPLLETVAWGIIHKAASSSSPPTRALAMIAGRISEDSRGVNLLVQGLRSQNSLIRSMAVQLCSGMRDAKLGDEMIRLLDSESVWRVRLEVIRAVGSMRLKSAKSRLEARLLMPRLTGEEQAALCEALVGLSDEVDGATLKQLIHAPRAAQRILACELAATKGLTEGVELLFALVSDPQASVRSAVLQALGLLRQPGAGALVSHAKAHLTDVDPLTAISAAWLLLMEEPTEGIPALRRWLSHSKREYRLIAAGAIASGGTYGVELAKEGLASSSDPYVRLNLALGLISQRVNMTEATETLVQVLKLGDRWMLKQEGIFQVIAPSTVRHQEGIPNYPEAVNQVTRLQIINLLAMLRHPQAWDSVKEFLKERNWGVSGMAAAVLLTEGDAEAVTIVRLLLSDPDLNIRTQAALVLSMWGGGEESLEVLQKAYFGSDRPMKEKILEAVGRIGSMSSIGFLLNGLREPHQHLRIIAASAVLQCINH